ncbi:MAG: SDR family NAD(P)-dependent oxidoreductase [Ignavibacteriaceae bacterium]|nr:SDR family NAD(P)-dependent oxidoreductase [Ignavibacteriaceae bacterium]
MKTFILNGTSRGLGLAMVKELIKQNETKIFCLVRDTNRIGKLESFESSIQIWGCDYSEVNFAINTKDFFNKITYSENVYFINNLSVIEPIDKIQDLDENSIVENININITSNLIVIKEFLQAVQTYTNSNVYILNISSGISKSNIPGLFMYGLAKAYLDYLTSSLNIEYNIYSNIKVKATSFYPAGLKTDMQNKLQESLLKHSLQGYDYSKIFTQYLEDPKKIAEIIYANFFKNNIGWNEEINSLKNFLSYD